MADPVGEPDLWTGKVLTIRQPWAALIALSVKKIETRGWQTGYRGPLLIHAGKAEPITVDEWMVGSVKMTGVPTQYTLYGPEFVSIMDGGPGRSEHMHSLPLGAAVATCTLADVVPIVAEETNTRDFPAARCIGLDDEGILRLWTRFEIAGEVGYAGDGRYHDQLPYGDFTPGRYAWLLTDVRPIRPVPMKGKQGLWTADEIAVQTGSTGDQT